MTSTLIAVAAFAVVVLVCVGVHELGHFVFAKICGIRVDEFAIGFGPKLLAWGKGETRYSIRALPLGGYVRMAGMIGLPGEADAGARNFYRASIPKRLAVMFAGIAFNLILAFLIFTVALTMGSASKVFADTPARAAGLHDGDSLVSIGGMAVDRSSSDRLTSTVRAALMATQGNPVRVVFISADGVTQTTALTPALDVDNNGLNNPDCDHARLPQGSSYITAINGELVSGGEPSRLLGAPNLHVSGHSLAGSPQSPCPAYTFVNIPFPGIGGDVSAAWKLGMRLEEPGLAVLPAAGAAANAIWQFIPNTIDGIRVVASTPGSGGVFGANGLQGPVGIAQQAGDSAQQGPQLALFFIAVISMNIGYLNLLPIPFLDGGKIVIVLIEAARGKRMAPQREAAVYAAGLAIMVLLVVFITIANLRNH